MRGTRPCIWRSGEHTSARAKRSVRAERSEEKPSEASLKLRKGSHAPLSLALSTHLPLSNNSCRHNFLEGARALLQTAADPTVANFSNETPGAIAVKARKMDFVELFKEYTITPAAGGPVSPSPGGPTPGPRHSPRHSPGGGSPGARPTTPNENSRPATTPNENSRPTSPHPVGLVHQPPSPSPKASSRGWLQYYDNDGNPYIHHPDTQQSLWGLLASATNSVNSPPTAQGQMTNPFNLSVSTTTARNNGGQFSSPRNKASPSLGGGRQSPSPASSDAKLQTPRRHHWMRRAYDDSEVEESDCGGAGKVLLGAFKEVDGGRRERV